MASFLTEFKHLEIKLEEIKSATNNFDEKNVIGHGGFGKVYEGKLAFPHPEGEILVALKRLDRKYGQGDPEFYKEIRFLSCYRHANLISLLGFCNQGGEMILVYEHASGGSLDRILNSAALTWPQRLKICLDAAKGISFLHDPNGAHQRVLHCDIKSANILLDKNMNAKVSDFGLSKMGSANQQYSALITNAAGTPGYCDPLFMKTYCLTKESDVYSFGVVLFEVLCGRLCAEFSNGQLKTIFVPMWKKSYEEKKLYDIIFKDLKQQMNQKSLETFADIAFQCLQKYREQRPAMSLVLQKLKIALEFQDPVNTSLTYKGFLVNGGKMDNVDALIECVMRGTGFSRGKPVAAFTIYKCLVHWESFQSERTSVFDRLIQMIGSAIEFTSLQNHEDNNEYMAYWLSNTSALLFLIDRRLKPAGVSSVQKSPPPTSLFGRMAMGFLSSSVSLVAPAAALEVVRQDEAKYPASLFKQQLTAYVEKIYGIVRDNLKKELVSSLALCIKVPLMIVQKIFSQVFSYINVQLLNSLLLRRECCTFSNGEYVKAGLAVLEMWCGHAKEEYAGSAWEELKHIRQAVGFLVFHEKDRISYDDITNDLCPVLSLLQLYRICTLYWDDNYKTKSVSQEVISSMRVLMTEDANIAVSCSFLLDDNSSSIPFSVDDLSTSLQVKDFADVKPAVELAENPAFLFLL
ncbi:hypothetical protein CTI12_AA112870 [Artemisia annua]|uniref:Uncharacterized protein n=1 Tax=Artemisia annua TaxID=35608 RepID=A0A2U1N031_ARTAN|nr:hypothetical protein CTI12_AA112870 [Artemisia annua]